MDSVKVQVQVAKTKDKASLFSKVQNKQFKLTVTVPQSSHTKNHHREEHIPFNVSLIKVQGNAKVNVQRDNNQTQGHGVTLAPSPFGSVTPTPTAVDGKFVSWSPYYNLSTPMMTPDSVRNNNVSAFDLCRLCMLSCHVFIVWCVACVT